MGHREHHVGAAPVLELEQLLDVVPTGLAPRLSGLQHRHQHLVPADRVHLLAHDLDDVLMDPLPGGQPRPQPRADLADQAGADHQLVRDRLGVGRRLAFGRKEVGGQTGHAAAKPTPEPSAAGCTDGHAQRAHRCGVDRSNRGNPRPHLSALRQPRVRRALIERDRQGRFRTRSRSHGLRSPTPSVRLQRARATHRRGHDAGPSRQASPGLRDQRERRARGHRVGGQARRGGAQEPRARCRATSRALSATTPAATTTTRCSGSG